MFDDSEMNEVNGWLENARRSRFEIDNTDFSDIANYCVARREDTIKLFIEMSQFLENNIDVFYNPKWKWVASTIYRSLYTNSINPIYIYKHPEYTENIHIGIPNSIKFVLNTKENRVIWITSEQPNSFRLNDMEIGLKFNFFSFFDRGRRFPSSGYEKYLKDAPAIELYFDEDMGFGKSNMNAIKYLELKKMVDEDWKNACICRDKIKEMVKSIMESNQKILSDITTTKDAIKKETLYET